MKAEFVKLGENSQQKLKMGKRRNKNNKSQNSISLKPLKQGIRFLHNPIYRV